LGHVDESGCELCRNGCPIAAAAADDLPKEADAYLHHKDGHRVAVTVRATPLKGPDDKVLGVVQVFADRSERSSLLAELETLRKEVLTDAMTGLGNRRYAELCASDALNEQRTGGKGFGVLMLDVDHFKRVNDSYGHASGDRVLRMVGWTLANAVRRNDAASRWGGEEFLVVCPGTDRALLAEVADQDDDGLVQFAGLAPGFIGGLLQLNVLIPDVAPGELAFDVSVGGVAAASTVISIAARQ